MPSEQINEFNKKDTIDVWLVSNKIQNIINEIDKDFWVPAVTNGQIGIFVKFVLDNDLIEKFNLDNLNSSEDLSSYINRVCKEIDKDLWVPGVENQQIGEFVQFCNKNNLWERFREIF